MKSNKHTIKNTTELRYQRLKSFFCFLNKVFNIVLLTMMINIYFGGLCA